MTPRYSLIAHQQGFTLVVALVFLAVLAVLGVSVARNSSMDERMAGNTRDRDLAFQAAEAALRDAEADMFPGYLADPFDGSTPGLIPYAPNGNNPAYWQAYNWAAASQEATAALANVDAKPRYVIERKPDTITPANPPAAPLPITVRHYRVTARGVGSSADAAVILQAEYEYN